MILRIGYRVQQFLAALNFRSPVEEAALRAHLSPAQVELFWSMPTSEQRHALGVLRSLQREGHTEATLTQAALLHDVAKGGDVRLWHRVVAVLLQAIHPMLLRQAALNEDGGWRYPFFVLLHHASCGAQMAAAAGTDPSTVALIRWHHAAPEESDLDSQGQALLAALRSADEQN